eukprot:13677309-Ditylum_brightwellii.AAC.1
MGSFKFVNTCSLGSKAVQWVLSNIGELNINKCNGAMLSDRFLEKLTALSEQHGFVIAMDMVLTGGRQTLQKPISFINRSIFGLKNEKRRANT